MLRPFMCSGIVLLAIAGVVCGDVLWIAPSQPGYTSMTKDAKLRGDGGLGDYNIGAGSAAGGNNRFYALNYDDGGVINPTDRLNSFLQWFDVSSIPAGSAVTKADLWFYMGAGNTGADFYDVKLSRLRAGKDWIEGVNQGPATDGSVTWNNQVSSATPVPWDAPGAYGANDIDQASSISFGWTFDSGDWICLDIKDWVQDWVNGTWANTGMVYWGGTVVHYDPAKYFMFNTKEDVNGPELWVEYVIPEPASLLLLAGGLALALRRRAAM